MSTARSVPVTRDEDLEGDEALKTLRGTARWQLVGDAMVRFRAADGFSHSRALGFQITLTLLPALIAVIGLAEALEQETARRVVQETINALAPGAAGYLLTDALRQGTSTARQESGQAALTGGLLAGLVAGTTAMAQIEGGANASTAPSATGRRRRLRRHVRPAGRDDRRAAVELPGLGRSLRRPRLRRAARGDPGRSARSAPIARAQRMKKGYCTACPD